MAELWSQDCTTNMTMVADPTLPVAHRGTRGPFPEPAAENPQSSVVLSNPGHPYDQAALMVWLGLLLQMHHYMTNVTIRDLILEVYLNPNKCQCIRPMRQPLL